MDIFEFAMQKERLSEDLYRDLARRTENKGLQTIFTMLADEEAHHYTVVEQMKTGVATEVRKTDVLTDAKEVFLKMRKSAENFDLDVGQIDVYKKAQDIEKQSRDFYLEKAAQVQDDRQKDIFAKLADEEKKHYFLLESIIVLVCRPETWLENAEFYHLEEY